jgi:hypothetical protein
MSTSVSSYPREYRIRVSQEMIRSFPDPHNSDVRIIHAYVKVADFPHSKMPDEINPRRHEKLTGRIPKDIKESIEDGPYQFHLLNRGLLIIAQKTWYDNKQGILHIVIDKESDGGLADGATTDRVIGDLKKSVSNTDFELLKPEEIPSYLQDSYVHIEIISGVNGEILIPLTAARNTSLQVKEFALEDLGHGYDVLKKVFEESRYKNKIRYRENDIQPVDIRNVLALLTLFHPRWDIKGGEPVIAYSAKGSVLKYYQDEDWKEGYLGLAPVAVDILDFYVYVQVHFHQQYQKAFGNKSKLGKRKEVRYTEGKTISIPYTSDKIKYGIADGWLYPLVAAFRPLLIWPKNVRGNVEWMMRPEECFDKYGNILLPMLIEYSENMGRNANATGKSKFLWTSLRDKVSLLIRP